MQTKEAKITLDAAPCFASLLDRELRFIGFKGGRGGGKSEAVAEYIIFLMGTEKAKVLCTREIQRSIKESVKSLLERKIEEKGLSDEFEIVETEIRHKSTGAVCLFAGLQNHTANSIKSYDSVDFCWVEEAQTIKAKSLGILIPTIRKASSRVVFTWNPETEIDAIELFWKAPRARAECFTVNFTDNKYCTDELKDDAETCRVSNPDEYGHIWLGEYVSVVKGAYYAKQLSAAIQEGRIGYVPHDPNAEVYMAVDLGMADLTTIWMYQFIGREIHFIDYYQSQYTSASDDGVILSKKPYKFATMWLPHDAEAKQKGTGKSTKEVYKNLGFDAKICPKISVKQGIDAGRDVFARCWFDSTKCEEGLKALRSYHEDYNDDLRIGRGPVHDGDSHAADAFRYFAVSMSSNRVGGEAQKFLPENNPNISKEDLHLTNLINEKYEIGEHQKIYF